ncbi:MAG: response regulator [Verrucomicrobiota bacterium]
MNPNPPKKILIADDQLYMIRLLEMTLKKGGYEVISCRDGNDALASATRLQPQLIVLDLIMPGLDGFGALRQLKENPVTQNIPVIVLSTKGHTLTRVETEQAGAAQFFTKPFSPVQLLDEIKRILEPAAS